MINHRTSLTVVQSGGVRCVSDTDENNEPNATDPDPDDELICCVVERLLAEAGFATLDEWYDAILSEDTEAARK